MQKNSHILQSLLSQPKRFQPLTEDDGRLYGAADLIMLDPPRTGDALCDQKRRNWIDWRAAPYQVKRHSEYLFDPTRDLAEGAPRLLLSAVMPAPLDSTQYLASIRGDKRYTVCGRKAESRGYVPRVIAPAEHAHDIWDIIHSSTERQGREIAPMFADRPRDWSFPEYRNFAHPEYQDICAGVFSSENRLVAYLLGKRVGHHVQYDEIMGHADHVGSDVMYLLHYYFLLLCSALGNVPQCLNYGPWYSGENPYSAIGGLNAWKRRIGFRPAYLILASS